MFRCGSASPSPPADTASARHRIGKGRALRVINTVAPTAVPGDEAVPDRLVWVGPDDRGLDLEIVAVREPDYLLVIHVMPHRFRRRTP